MANPGRLQHKGITNFTPEDAEGWMSRLQLIVPFVRTYSVSLNLANVAANTVADQTLTVTGLTTNSIIFVNPPALTAGLIIGYARASAANTLQLRMNNTTGSSINESVATWLIAEIRL